MLFNGGLPPTYKPDNCRMRQQRRGVPYPRSGCEVCHIGGLAGCPYEPDPNMQLDARAIAEELNRLEPSEKPSLDYMKLLRRAVILLVRASHD